jgi:hypothetical protein
MSGCSVLDIGLTVGDPPDNKVCLQISPSDTEKKKVEEETQFYISAKHK